MQNLSKYILEDLNFHDCKIYAIGFDEKKYELLIDIDFIEEWIESENQYKFRVAPATLVFNNVIDLDIDISMNTSLIIDSIGRSNPQIPKNIKYLQPLSKEYDWIIETLQGEIRFKSIGLIIYQREGSIISDSQYYEIKDDRCFSLEKKGVKIHVV